MIATSFSTGGGGVNFELKVASAFLATFICGAPCPCFHNERILSIRFQSKQAGKETDDLLIKTQDDNDHIHQLLCQIKHKLTVSKENQEFKETLQRAWKDFSAEDFDQNKDCIAFITGPTTAKNIEHVRTIFEMARHCANEQEFFDKIKTPRFTSQIKRGVVLIIEELLEEFLGAKQSNNIVWKFLKRLHFFSYDFDVEYSLDENRVIELIELNKSSESTDTAKGLWSQIVGFSQICNQNSTTLDRKVLASQLPEALSKFLLKNSVIMHSKDIKRLLEHSEFHLKTIETEILSGITLARSALISSAKNMLNSSQILLVTSEAGGGKSALVKILLSNEIEEPVFAFRVESFDHPHLQQAFVSMGVNCGLKELSVNMGLLQNRLIFIDSVERLLEMDHRDALVQLLKLVAEDNRIRLILTCRSYAESIVVSQLLAIVQINPAILRVPELSKNEVTAVCSKVHALSSLNLNDTLLSVLKNPFYLAIAARSLPSEINDINLSSESIRKVLWKEAVCNPKIGKAGLPDRREILFCEIAVTRAKTMQPFVKINVTDHEALNALINDNIIEKNATGFFASAHDLFEDIGVETCIEKCYVSTNGDYHRLFLDIGPEPAMRRAFRKWLVSSLCLGDPLLIQACLKILRDKTVEQFWQDEVLVGILISDQSDVALENLKDGLLEDKKALFIRSVHLLRTACKKPNAKLIRQMGLTDLSVERLGTYLTLPNGRGWQGLIKIVAENLINFDLEDVSMVLPLVRDWSDAIDVNDPLDQTAHQVVQICFHFYDLMISDDKWRSGTEESFIDIILKLPAADPVRVRDLYKKAFSLEDRGDRHLVECALKAIKCFPLVKDFPDIIYHCLDIYAEPRQRSRGHFAYRGSIHLEDDFGLGGRISIRENPSSSIQGPFGLLLKFHPVDALDFLVRFVNNAMEAYKNSDLDGNKEALEMQYKEQSRMLISSPRLWVFYRGQSPGPDLLISCLMA